MKNITLEPFEYSNTFLSRMHELNKQAMSTGCDTVDIEYVKKGLAFAKHYHGSQIRKSGEPYYTHPIAVANTAADYIFRENVLAASLLHDTIEDTTLTLGEIEVEFGARVAEMVSRLTRFVDPETGKRISARECLLKVFELGDVESTLIKMLDRWHNMETIDSMSNEKQEKIIDETLKEFLIIAACSKISNSKALTLELEISRLCYEKSKINNKNFYKDKVNQFFEG